MVTVRSIHDFNLKEHRKTRLFQKIEEEIYPAVSNGLFETRFDFFPKESALQKKAIKVVLQDASFRVIVDSDIAIRINWEDPKDEK